MECSTTELRQRAREKLNRPRGPVQAGGSCHRPPLRASETAPLPPGKSAEITFRVDHCGQSGRFRPDWVPDGAGRLPIHQPPNHAVARNWPAGQGARGAAIVYAWGAQGDGGSRNFAMTGDQDRGGGQAGARVKDARQDRLKLALRENLKRRKSQARGREDVASEPADGPLDVGSPDDTGANGPDR